MQKAPKDAAAAKDVLKFFRWAYSHGEAAAKELHYVPLPGAVAKSVEKTWKDKLGVSL